MSLGSKSPRIIVYVTKLTKSPIIASRKTYLIIRQRTDVHKHVQTAKNSANHYRLLCPSVMWKCPLTTA